jgi:hypothetical protein
MEALLGAALLLLAQALAGGALALDVPHALQPGQCQALWQAVTGDCSPCATGLRWLSEVFHLALPAACG